jgi:hypothetical protein
VSPPNLTLNNHPLSVLFDLSVLSFLYTPRVPLSPYFPFISEQIWQTDKISCSRFKYSGANIPENNFYLIFTITYILYQGFPTCGTRTTGGTRRGFRWYAESFCFIKSQKLKLIGRE